jgi:hypothetical protein
LYGQSQLDSFESCLHGQFHALADGHAVREGPDVDAFLDLDHAGNHSLSWRLDAYIITHNDILCNFNFNL